MDPIPADPASYVDSLVAVLTFKPAMRSLWDSALGLGSQVWRVSRVLAPVAVVATVVGGATLLRRDHIRYAPVLATLDQLWDWDLPGEEGRPADVLEQRRARQRECREGGRFVAKIAREARAKHFGTTPARTPANEEVAKRVLIRIFAEHSGGSHRTDHIARDLPLALELLFAPTAAEIDARRFGRSLPVWWRKLRHASNWLDFLLPQ
jgi:hypothetical protein